MKTIFISLLLPGLAAGAFGLIALRGDKQMLIERKESLTTSDVPSIDAQVPGMIETATFALG